MPPLLVELAVGIFIPLVFVALRASLVPVLGDRAPYAFNFLAVVCATVLAGWRAGLVALAVGQAALWLLVVEQQWGGPPIVADRLGGLAISSVAQILTLSVITLYQREVAKGLREQDRRMDLLDQARREIDHRAKNNFQTVLSLVQLQASREQDPNVKLALQQVADRILAISVATEHLAIRSEDLATVKLRDHLCELCSQLERGLARGEVRVECDIPDVTANADTAIHLAIIVNELVTNALKHAFDDGARGLVQVHSRMVGNALELEISDNGHGMKKRPSSPGSGLGQKLVDTFARHLNAEHEISSSPEGTRHRILVPALA